ncbi:MAG: hypothetical protein GEU95_15185 [Rhizobiales bacterium]|nr:hypothetical protein [Hyphomicrobiales bacterium]
MKPRQTAVAAVLCAALLVSLPARAETKRQERVSVTGCPYAGVTANCLMIKGPGDTVYNISSIRPRPRQSGRMIRVRGSVTDKMSICGEGVVLERIRWTRRRQRCPN